MLATFAVYQPAWTGTLLWDDAQHLTRPELRSFDGLRRAWFEPGATQQYYPLLHTAFWLQHRLWGDATFGYHLVNILLHGCSAFLLGLVLRRLAIPGAWFAAAIFALHPVHVESVAWMTELKNTLSGTFGLAAVLLYLDFDESRRPDRLWAALALFLLALLSKTVTAMLPVVLLVVLWWKRGAVSWRRDVLPLAPFLATGAAAGLATAWVERSIIGATGTEYDFTPVERGLIAGRAMWFYLGKLAWPADLIFIYPRWEVNQAVWWQYLYPLAGGVALGLGWMVRRRTRTPLAVLLAFLAALFPVLGFFNVYPFRFSFVADHFQYLASIPIITLFAASVTTLLARLRAAGLVKAAVPAAIVVVLGSLTFRESHEYANETTLYQATLRDNPSCWLAHVNLGKAAYDSGTSDLDDAVEHFKSAILLKPDLREAHFDLGLAYHRMGRLEDAVASYEEAVRLSPGIAETYWNLCTALRTLDRIAEARKACDEAVRLEPDSIHARFGLCVTLHVAGELEEALACLERAARLAPAEAEVFYEKASVLQELGRKDEAAAAYRETLRLSPGSPAALANLGFILYEQGRTEEAMRLYGQALGLNPRYAPASYYLGIALQAEGRLDEAVEQYRRVLAIDPSDAAAHANLGLALEEMGRASEAAVHYEEALRLRPDLQQARENLRRLGAAARKSARGVR